MKIRILCMLICVALILCFSSPNTFAAGQGKNILVIGDSISTGYGLASPTSRGFVYLLAEEQDTVVNMAVDGNTVVGILDQLTNSANPKHITKSQIEDADVITVTCGGNDLLAFLYGKVADVWNGIYPSSPITAEIVISRLVSMDLRMMVMALDLLNESSATYLINDPDFNTALNGYISGLNSMTSYIRAINPNVQIIVATQYNPYAEFKDINYVLSLNPLYNGIEEGVTKLNTAIKNNASIGGYIVTDVKQAFDIYNGGEDLYNANPSTDAMNIDFHPTAAGHGVIADTFANTMSLLSVEENSPIFNINTIGELILSEEDGKKYYQQGDGDRAVYTGAVAITGEQNSGVCILVESGTHDVVLNNVTLDNSGIDSSAAFYIQNTASVNMILIGTNTLKSGFGYAGLQVADNATLTIDAKSNGSLIAIGGSQGAGIGGGSDGNGGTVRLVGGNVIAIGKDGADAIGKGDNGSGSSIILAPAAGEHFIVKNTATDTENIGVYMSETDIASIISGQEALYITDAHMWINATCTAPKTCSVCESTEGFALGHVWTKATCTAPKTCSVCELTEGEALGHDWKEATCSAPNTCGACGMTKGDVLDHTWKNATCTNPKTCSVCGATEGEAAGHSGGTATCGAKAICSECGYMITEAFAGGDVNAHSFTVYKSNGNADCTADGTKTAKCDNCDATDTKRDEGSKLAHTFEKGICIDCGEEEPNYTDAVLLWAVISVTVVLVVSGFAVYLFVIRKKRFGIQKKKFTDE